MTVAHCKDCETWRKNYNVAIANGLVSQARHLDNKINAHARAAAPAGETPPFCMACAHPGHPRGRQCAIPAIDTYPCQCFFPIEPTPEIAAARGAAVPPAPVPAAGLREALDAWDASQRLPDSALASHIEAMLTMDDLPLASAVDATIACVRAALLDSDKPGLDVERQEQKKVAAGLIPHSLAWWRAYDHVLAEHEWYGVEQAIAARLKGGSDGE